MKKIADLPREKRCQDPSHNPPSMWCPREPGIYEHECPACGAKSRVIHDPPTLGPVPDPKGKPYKAILDSLTGRFDRQQWKLNDITDWFDNFRSRR